jgi:hypothetical protein
MLRHLYSLLDIFSTEIYSPELIYLLLNLNLSSLWLDDNLEIFGIPYAKHFNYLAFQSLDIELITWWRLFQKHLFVLT